MVGHFTDNIHKKNFYRYHFRKNIKRLFYSMIVMSILVVILFGLTITEGKSNYYATNSAGFITPLKVLLAPNNSQKELLAPDPVEEVQTKKLPDNF